MSYQRTLGTPGNGIFALTGVPPKRGTLVPVATRTLLSNMRNLSDGTQTQETSRVLHKITADCSGLRVGFANISSNNNALAPTDGPNTITIRFDLEDAAGKRKRGWTAGGSRNLVVEPGGIGWLDVQGNFKKGDTVYSRTNVSVGSLGQKWPHGMTTNTGPQASLGEGVTVGSDLTLPSTTAVTQAFTFAYGPSMILGNVTTPVPTVAMIGDSIAASQADAADLGFIIRALNDSYGYVGLAQQGETTAMFLTADEGGTRAFALDHVTHAVTQYGVNDIYNNGASLATWQANSLTLWTGLARRGVKAWQTTITPKSASTDSFATLANQTPDAAITIRNNANDWLRAGAPIDPTSKAAVAIGTSGALLAGSVGHPLSGYFEVADIAESARNSGKWKVTGAANYATSDGTHPSLAMHTLMAAGVTPAAFTLTA